MVSRSATNPRAVATYLAPHDMAAFTLHDGESARFGRGADCEIRFGYAPEADEGLSRVAGRLIVTQGRVMVEAPNQPGKQILRVMSEGQPERMVGLGEVFSPAATAFTITVDGSTRKWPLMIAVRPEAVVDPTEPGFGEPTFRPTLTLSAGQSQILKAYAAPVMRGLVEPATHAEVADALHKSMSYVRETLYDVYTKMFTAGLTMQERSDKRYTVVEAARLYGLIVA